MGFFSEKDINLDSITPNKYFIPTPQENNIIDSCTTINGDISSCSNIIIKGSIIGNIESNATIIIGKNAKVQGNINAKALRVEGSLEGDEINCELLEVRKDAIIKVQKIEAINFFCNGLVEAVINLKEEFLLDKNGKIKADSIQAKTIISNGVITAKTIFLSDKMHLQSNSITKASIKSKYLICELGAKLQGDVVSSIKEVNALLKEEKSYKKEAKRIYTKKEQASV